MAYQVRIGQREFYAVRGNLHMHTTDSDGTRSHQELAQIAARAGLDFIIITDHNVYQAGLDSWVGKTLLLVGEEVHDPQRELQSSHTLCLGIHADVAQHGGQPQELFDAVAQQGGCSFLAHPFERDVAGFLPEPNISWRDWDATGYDGIELWNYMSEFKSALRNKISAVVNAFAPDLAIRGPYPETLRKWDELLRNRRVAVLGGSDAHGTVYQMGPLTRAVQPYEYLFQCINTHLLLDKPLSGTLEADRIEIYAALRAGRGFVCYERPGRATGFTFLARSGEAEASMGETLSLQDVVELRMTTPAPSLLRLLRNGKVIAQSGGRELAMLSPQPGVYRAEAYRRHAGRKRGWIFSNPVYVTPNLLAPTFSPRAAPISKTGLV